MSIAIGMKVVKSGIEGIIVKIITKSTGYVQVDFNGKLKKEMAFNLKDENGVCLKNKKSSETAGMSRLQKESFLSYKISQQTPEETARANRANAQFKAQMAYAIRAEHDINL